MTTIEAQSGSSQGDGTQAGPIAVRRNFQVANIVDIGLFQHAAGRFKNHPLWSKSHVRSSHPCRV